MWRILSFLVSLCLILLLNGVWVHSEEFILSEDDTDSNIHSQTVQPDISNGRTKDPDPMPEAPFPITTDGEDDDLIPPTPTANNIVVVGGGAGGAAAVISLPDNEDVSDTDSSDHSSESATDTNGVDGLPKAVPTHEHVQRATQEKKEPTESSQSATQFAAPDGKTPARPEAGGIPNTPGAAQESEEPSVIRLPASSETLDDFLQTQIFETSKMMHQHPSSEMDSVLFDPLQATEALKSVSPGTWESLSKLPVGVGGMAVEPDFRQEGLFTTQFSASGEKLGLDPEDVSEEGKKKGEEDFPTFDKWSVQYLAEQEKQKIEKEQEQATNPGAGVAQKKLRQNFAAAGCGAKVVASNAEAENTNFLLNGNPDEYMLSPCKAKKWFVVELCEPLQIHKVELGTMELFSSQPKSFRVFASQRFPTKEWISLGKFEMTPQRIVQSFHTQLNEEFVKFVKVEMLEHHGDEHYCPITTFRVLGIDMASDGDDDNDHETVEMEGEMAVDEEDEDEVEGSVNLFTSAKDTVVKLVQKVLYKGDPEATSEDKEKEAEHVVSDNITAKSEEKKGDGEEVPCPDKDSTGRPKMPTAEIPEAGKIPPPVASKEPEEVPIVTKLADTEQLPMDTTESPVVIKLEQEEETPSKGQDCIAPSFCCHSPWNLYVQNLLRKPDSASTCTIRPKASYREEETASQRTEQEPTSVGEIKPSDLSHGGSTEQHEEMKTVEEQRQKSETPASAEDISSDRSDIGSQSGAVPEASQQPEGIPAADEKQDRKPPGQKETQILPTEDQRHGQTPQDSLASSQSTSFSSAEVSSTQSDSLEPSSVSMHADLENEAVSVLTPGLDIQQSQVVEQGATDLAETIFLKVSPSPTFSSEDSQEGGDMLPEGPTAGERELRIEDTPQLSDSLPSPGGPKSDGDSPPDGVTPHQPLEPSKSLKEDVNGTGGGTTATNGKAAKPELVKVGMPSTAKRDTSLMKLNNRIVALEQNVSMTKKYLEELSRAFKLQNEEMMKLLNKTEKRLTLYIAQAEEREMHQQTRVLVLEQKVANLTQVVDTMQLKMDSMGKELRDGQLLLVFFQVLLFFWMMISSYLGRPKPGLTYTDHQFLLDTMPLKPVIEKSSGGMRQRRNSDVAIKSSSEQTEGTLKRQTSETNLAAPKKEDTDGTLLTQGPYQTSKKKKKKKLKHPQFSMDSATLPTPSTSGSIPTQSSSFSSSAGVLFGTSSASKPIDTKDSSLGECPSEWLNRDKENLCQTQDFKQALWAKGWFQDDGVKRGQNLFGSGAASFNFGVAGRENGHNVSNSSSPHAPDLCGRAALSSFNFFLEQDGLRTPPSEGPVSFGFSKSPLRENPVTEVTRRNSPEFKLPPYHRNKIRRVGDSNISNPTGTSFKYGKSRNSNLDQFQRRRSTDFINPVGGEEFFLAENYLFENRFKFPATPPRSATSWDNWYADETSHSFAENGQSGERYPPMMSCSVKNFPAGVVPSMLTSSSSRRSSSPPSSLSSFPSISSMSTGSRPKSPPSVNASRIQQDHTSVYPSFITGVPPRPPPPLPPPPPPPRSNPPLSLSQLSAQSLPQLSNSSSRKDQHHSHHHHHPSRQSVTKALEPGPVISSDISAKGNGKSPTSEVSKGNAPHASGEVDHGKPPNVHQTHRRQGSFPVDPHKMSKSMEKEPNGRARGGSFEVPKHPGKSGQSHQQGSKVKKSPSSPSFFTRKGSSSKQANNEKGTSNHTSNKKGPKSERH